MKTLKLLVLLVIFLFGGHVSAKQIFVGKPSTFKAKSSTGQERFEWSFPGGVKINGRVVSYTFDSPGTKTISLKVTNSIGQSNELSRTVVVYNIDKPTALINAKVNGKTFIDKIIKAKMGDTISLSSGAKDQSKNFVEEWKVNGRVYNQNQLPRVFNQIGTYQVGFNVYDPNNRSLSDLDTIQVMIENTAPTIFDLTFAESSKNPGQVRVRVNAEDTDGEIKNYKFEVLERGKIFLSQMTGVPETYFDFGNYSGAHVYSFRVTITDDKNAKVTYDSLEDFKFEKELLNNPPVAAIRLVPGNSGNLTTLFDFSVEASDIDKDALRYEWIFPDGKRYHSPTFRHRFIRAGEHKVILRVNDGITTIEKSVTISIFDKEKFRKKKNAKPRVALKGVLPKQFGDTNTTFRFYLRAEDPDHDRLEYLWDMGDGGKMFVKNPAYRFKKVGKYKVRVAVTDGHHKVIVPVDIVVRESDKDKKIKEDAELTLKLEKEAKALGKVDIAGPGQKKKIAERVKRLTEQADITAKKALARQAAARELVEQELEIQIEKRNKLIKELESQQSEKARASTRKKLEAVERDLAVLRKQQGSDQNPYEEELKGLERDLAEIKARIIVKQKSFLTEEIQKLENKESVETDREKKFGYGLNIKKYQQYLKSDNLLGIFAAEYKEGLLDQKNDLELSLENADEPATKILLQTRITAIERALMDLNELTKVKLNLAKTQKRSQQEVSDEDYDNFINKRISELTSERDKIELKLQSETDIVNIEVLKDRLSEVRAELEKLGFAKGEEINLDHVTIISAKAKLEWKILKTQTELNNVFAPAERELIEEKIKEYNLELRVLKNLDVSGLAPELTVYELTQKLTKKKKELIKIFKQEKDEIVFEKIRQKILLIEDSLKYLKDLELFNITGDTTLENAERLLNNKRAKMTRTYVSLKSSPEKEKTFKTIEKVNNLYGFLEKFYNPKSKDQTLGTTKKELAKRQKELREKLNQETNLELEEKLDQSLEKTSYDLVMIGKVEESLQDIIREQFKEDVKNYRETLLAEIDAEENLEKKVELEEELEKLDSRDVGSVSITDINGFQDLMADFVLNTGTQLSLYGKIPDSSHDRAVLFEWDLGNGKIVTGQNISVRYRDPGFYRISLKISDGLTESTDSLTIKVDKK